MRNVQVFSAFNEMVLPALVQDSSPVHLCDMDLSFGQWFCISLPYLLSSFVTSLQVYVSSLAS